MASKKVDPGTQARNVPPPITPIEFTGEDFDIAERIARSLGYGQTAYTSTSALWGLFCLPENPRTWQGKRRALQAACVIKTREFGFLVVQDCEDLGLTPTGEEE